MIGTENKTGHLSNVRSQRKQPFEMVEIWEFEFPLSATSRHSRSLRPAIRSGMSTLGFHTKYATNWEFTIH